MVMKEKKTYKLVLTANGFAVRGRIHQMEAEELVRKFGQLCFGYYGDVGIEYDKESNEYVLWNYAVNKEVKRSKNFGELFAEALFEADRYDRISKMLEGE